MTAIILDKPVTGDCVTLIEPQPKSPVEALIFELRLAPRAAGSPPHRHSRLHEKFDVLAGELEFAVNGKSLSLTAGQSIIVCPGTVHAFRNASGVAAVLRCTVTPGSAFDRFLRGMHYAAMTGQANSSGLQRDSTSACPSSARCRLPLIRFAHGGTAAFFRLIAAFAPL